MGEQARPSTLDPSRPGSSDHHVQCHHESSSEVQVQRFSLPRTPSMWWACSSSKASARPTMILEARGRILCVALRPSAIQPATPAIASIVRAPARRCGDGAGRGNRGSPDACSWPFCCRSLCSRSPPSVLLAERYDTAHEASSIAGEIPALTGIVKLRTLLDQERIPAEGSLRASELGIHIPNAASAFPARLHQRVREHGSRRRRRAAALARRCRAGGLHQRAPRPAPRNRWRPYRREGGRPSLREAVRRAGERVRRAALRARTANREHQPGGGAQPLAEDARRGGRRAGRGRLGDRRREQPLPRPPVAALERCGRRRRAAGPARQR